MIVLAIDTSTNVASCSIMEDNKLLGEITVNNKITHSQKLMPIIAEVLKITKLDIEDVDIFAGANGPGSFTGLRIGVSTLNGLAQATQKPVVGVNSLKALAQNIVESEKLIVPLIDARRDRVFTAAYNGVENLEQEIEPDVIEVKALLEILDEKNRDIIFIGDGSQIYRQEIIDVLGGRAYFTSDNLNIAKASSTALLAIDKAKAGSTQSHFEFTPNYYRETQAQREYEERTGKKS